MSVLAVPFPGTCDISKSSESLGSNFSASVMVYHKFFNLSNWDHYFFRGLKKNLLVAG